LKVLHISNNTISDVPIWIGGLEEVRTNGAKEGGWIKGRGRRGRKGKKTGPSEI
jgi:hypothetical protein